MVEIPGDYPLPEPGARVVVPVPPGGQVRFDLDAIDPSTMTPSLAGTDLVFELEDGGELVLQHFFAAVDPPAAIILGDTTISAEALLAQLGATGDREALADVAAGPAAGGGGEMFGLLQVVSWLVDRIDLVPTAEAGEQREFTQAGNPAGFDQLAAQLLIAREGEIARLSAAYRETTSQLLATIKDWLDSGGGSAADLSLARGFDLEAQIAAKDAAYRLVLAVDAHQDAYGERLETAEFPVWRSAPPDDLAALTAGLPAEQQAAARRYWRQANHARETLALLDTLTAVAEEVREAYAQQFEVGQRSLAELEAAHKTAFQARVRLTERRADHLIAEAWLLGAGGELQSDYIKHPGWQ